MTVWALSLHKVVGGKLCAGLNLWSWALHLGGLGAVVVGVDGRRDDGAGRVLRAHQQRRQHQVARRHLPAHRRRAVHQRVQPTDARACVYFQPLGIEKKQLPQGRMQDARGAEHQPSVRQARWAQSGLAAKSMGLGFMQLS